jgi:RNA 2',3'-cyclic 3'-phosphodiesterase
MNGARQTDSLFFAIFPDEAAASRIAAQTERLRTQHNIRTKPIPAERLHITLQYIGAFDGFPSDAAQRAIDAAKTIAEPPADITLDHIESFSSRRPKRPLVLSGQATPSLSALEQSLYDALTAQGIEPKRHPEFKPHITLLYTEQRVQKHAVTAITWQANEFALIHSHLGQSRHELIERWPLKP